LIDPALVGRRRGGSNVRDDDDAGGVGAGEVARGGGDGEEGEGEELAHFSDAFWKVLKTSDPQFGDKDTNMDCSFYIRTALTSRLF
jgi:hypothetical protein